MTRGSRGGPRLSTADGVAGVTGAACVAGAAGATDGGGGATVATGGASAALGWATPVLRCCVPMTRMRRSCSSARPGLPSRVPRTTGAMAAGGAVAATTSRAAIAAGSRAPGRVATRLPRSGCATGASCATRALASTCPGTFSVASCTRRADTKVSRPTTVVPEGTSRLM